MLSRRLLLLLCTFFISSHIYGAPQLNNDTSVEYTQLPNYDFENISPVENQLNCSHLESRFKLVKDILFEIAKIFKFSDFQAKESYRDERMKYFSERIDISMSDEFSKVKVRLKGKIDQKGLKMDWSLADGYAVSSFARSEVNTDGKFTHIPAHIEKINNEWNITIDLASGAACLDQKVYFYGLFNCDYDWIKFFCENEPCFMFKEYNWSTCRKTEVIELNLGQIQSQIGFRGNRLGRSKK